VCNTSGESWESAKLLCETLGRQQLTFDVYVHMYVDKNGEGFPTSVLELFEQIRCIKLQSTPHLAWQQTNGCKIGCATAVLVIQLRC
jgi:hypothetical protein